MVAFTPITLSSPGTPHGSPPTPSRPLPNSTPSPSLIPNPPNPSPTSAPSPALPHTAIPTSPTPSETSPPNRPIDDLLLEALIAPIGGQAPSPVHLARKFNVSVTLVLDFIAAPTTRARIAAAVAASDLALHQRSQSARLRAIDTLEELLDSAETPVERRRAASALLRGPTRSSSRIFAFSSTDSPLADDQLPESRPIRPRPPSPSLTAKPAQVVAAIVDRLLDNDNPQPNSGLHTIHNFRFLSLFPDDRAKHREKYLNNPGRDAYLLGATSAVLHPPLDPQPDPLPKDHPDHYTTANHRFAQTVTFRFPDLSTHSATFHIRLIQESNPTREMWHLNRIEHHLDSDADDDPDDVCDTDNAHGRQP